MFGLGAAIVVMTVLLVVGLLLGWHKKEPTVARGPTNPVASVPQVETGGAPAGPVTPLDVTVPPDAAIYTITGDGPLVALHVRSPGGDEVIVVNTVENRVISRIRLKTEGSATP